MEEETELKKVLREREELQQVLDKSERHMAEVSMILSHQCLSSEKLLSESHAFDINLSNDFRKYFSLEYYFYYDFGLLLNNNIRVHTGELA